MIRTLSALAMVLVAQVAFAQETKLETPAQQASYAIGYEQGGRFANPDIPFDLKALLAGFQDGLNGAKPKLTDEQVNAAMQAFQMLVQAEMTKKAEEDAKAGEKFLAENAKKEGVKTTESGLQYQVVKAGTGAVPTLTDRVVCNYRGTLVNGKQFDSSYDRGEPATFGVNQVIPGWTEALQMMKVGAKWNLFIPAKLAYGDRSVGGIPPNSVLVFDIELLDIAK